MSIELTREVLQRYLDYTPETGALKWRARTPDMFEAKKVSADIACRRWNGRCAGKSALVPTSHGYLTVRINRRPFYAHRVIWAMLYGSVGGLEIDHINGDRSDNRPANLRVVTRRDNMRNKRMSDKNTSGVTGVSPTENGKWLAAIGGAETREYLGIFADFDEAVAARRDAEQRHGYHPNHGLA